MTTPTLKRCCDCSRKARRDVRLPVESFHRCRRNLDGLQDVCKACARARVSAWRVANHERQKAQARRRYRIRTVARLKELHDA